MLPVLSLPKSPKSQSVQPVQQHGLAREYRHHLCTGRKSLLEYIAQYASKPEEGRQSYRQLMQTLLANLS
jgi:hypothetical protein